MSARKPSLTPDVTSLPILATAVEFILNDNTGTSRPARRSFPARQYHDAEEFGRDSAAELADAIGSIDVAGSQRRRTH